jgi:hypothetical protein
MSDTELCGNAWTPEELKQLAQDLKCYSINFTDDQMPDYNGGQLTKQEIVAIASQALEWANGKQAYRSESENLADLYDDIRETIAAVACCECQAYAADGEGYDGLCGNCADVNCNQM